MISFSIGQKQISLFPSTLPHRPVIYLHTFGKEGEAVYRALQEIYCPAFTLAAVSGLQWDHDMTPWAIPPISPNDTPCTGGAQEYLGLLVGEILPRVEQNLLSAPSWRGIAGYSLGGLFAVYSLYQTDLFSRAASVSGLLVVSGHQGVHFLPRDEGKAQAAVLFPGEQGVQDPQPLFEDGTAEHPGDL